MLAVSQNFKDKVLATSRKIVGRVTVNYTDPILDESFEATTNGDAEHSYPEQVYNGIETPGKKWIALDGSWILDGTSFLMPDSGGYDVGWWGNVLAGVGGAFSAPYPTLTLTFSARPITEFVVVGDSLKAEYPVDFVVKAYGAGDALLHTETVTGNNLVNWRRTVSNISDVVKMTLEITKWSHAGRVVKILEFYSTVQETYTGKDLVSVSLREEREISMGSLPVGNISSNEVTVRINNIDGKFDAGNIASPLHGLIKPNRRIKPEIGVETSPGVIEYVSLGQFWSGEWKAPESEIYAETTARDLLETLRNTTYSTNEVKANTTLYQLAVDVLADAGLVAGQYIVDTELQSYSVPYGWLDVMSHREALRTIAEAGLAQAYCDRAGILRVEGPSYLATNKTTSQVTITRANYTAADTPPNHAELKNYIEVPALPLQLGTTEEVYRSSEPENVNTLTKTVTVFYDKKPVIDAVASLADITGTVLIADADYYSWGADIHLYSPNNGTATIVINGKPLVTKGKTVAKAQDSQSIKENGNMRFEFPENPLIQSKSLAQTIANKLLASYKDPRRDITIEWRGHPALELGDRFTAPDSRTSTGQFNVTSNTLEFDGSLTGSIKGRRAT